ncbi:glutaredoxin family protein [Jeotgalibacillus aurantiacus]|uniref:glutaredoxin family protein n=1 Tax=Jeotgalibacillus aurantiacus TaxID=2763266 RepID=UPI001D0B8B30|nr:glutaredoxin family protein [Jeotgalibacillus aurantiacus]
MIVHFYTRPNCGLCEEARLMLELVQEDVHFDIEERNIDTSDEWTEKYGLMIPVIAVDDEIVQAGQIDYMTISKRFQKNT